MVNVFRRWDNGGGVGSDQQLNPRWPASGAGPGRASDLDGILRSPEQTLPRVRRVGSRPGRLVGEGAAALPPASRRS